MRWKLKSIGVGVHYTIFLWDIAGLMPYASSLEGHMEGQGPLESFFLCGQLLEGKLSLVRISSREVIQWWVGVVCVVVVGRLWITSWFTVAWLLSCGALYLWCLGFNGFYWRRFLIYYVGGYVEDHIQISRILFHYLWCGLYGAVAEPAICHWEGRIVSKQFNTQLLYNHVIFIWYIMSIKLDSMKMKM